MRPMLRPGLAVAWRSPTSLQLGVDSPEPLVLDGLSAQSHRALELMDGTRTAREVLDQANVVAGSADPTEVRDLLARLSAQGAVIDAGRWPGGKDVPTPRRERMLPDLLARAPRDPDHWWRSLAGTHVTVVGASRVGSVVARTLEAAGIGRVSVDDPRPVTTADVVLGGFEPADVGRPRSELLLTRLDESSAPSVPTGDAERRLSVLTDAVDIDSQATELAVTGTAYLVVRCREQTGQVGPLVEPGTTACHFCVELHRRDHDPAWPQVWRQRTWDASPVALASTASLTAHLAAAHVIEWALGDPVPTSRGVIEVDARLAQSGFHPTPPHPECGCTWRPLAV